MSYNALSCLMACCVSAHAGRPKEQKSAIFVDIKWARPLLFIKTMKSPARLQISTRARAGRLMLLVAVVAAWILVVLATLPRTTVAGSDTKGSTPDERTTHYNFPTYG
jgi:hypothetical protein